MSNPEDHVYTPTTAPVDAAHVSVDAVHVLCDTEIARLTALVAEQARRIAELERQVNASVTVETYKGLMLNQEEARATIARQAREIEGLTAERDRAEGVLASTTDLLNSWARESSVQQANAPAEARDVADRLWAHWSQRYAEQAREIERLLTQVFVPGHWRCAECGFYNVRATINANTDRIGVGSPADVCPNDGALMQPIRWADYARDGAEARDENLAALAHARVREALVALVHYVEHDTVESTPLSMDCLGECPASCNADDGTVQTWQLVRAALAAPAPDGAKVLAVVKAAFDRDGIADEKAAHRLTCRAWWCEIDDAIARRQVAAAQRERDALAALRADPAWKGVG